MQLSLQKHTATNQPFSCKHKPNFMRSTKRKLAKLEVNIKYYMYKNHTCT